ncbi:hypothetical protein [Dactylosporangium cerinum]
MSPPSVVELIGCLAVQSEPVGVILVDLHPALLPQHVELLAEAVRFHQGHEPPVRVLDAGVTDDDLWPRWVLAAGRSGLGLQVRDGALSPVVGAPGPIVVVPDLARAGTAVARAAVAALGNDVVHVERYGFSRSWSPAGLWLASCARQDLAALSTHLLDRFPIRFDCRAAAAPGPVTWSPRGPRATVPPGTLDLILRAATGRPSARLDLALARMARAAAELRGGPVVQDEDVARAAALVGLAQPEIPRPTPVDGPEPAVPRRPPNPATWGSRRQSIPSHRLSSTTIRPPSSRSRPAPRSAGQPTSRRPIRCGRRTTPRRCPRHARCTGWCPGAGRPAGGTASSSVMSAATTWKTWRSFPRSSPPPGGAGGPQGVAREGCGSRASTSAGTGGGMTPNTPSCLSSTTRHGAGGTAVPGWRRTCAGRTTGRPRCHWSSSGMRTASTSCGPSATGRAPSSIRGSSCP